MPQYLRVVAFLVVSVALTGCYTQLSSVDRAPSSPTYSDRSAVPPSGDRGATDRNNQRPRQSAPMTDPLVTGDPATDAYDVYFSRSMGAISEAEYREQIRFLGRYYYADSEFFYAWFGDPWFVDPYWDPYVPRSTFYMAFHDARVHNFWNVRYGISLYTRPFSFGFAYGYSSPWYYDRGLYGIGYADGYYDGFYDGYYGNYYDSYYGGYYAPYSDRYRTRYYARRSYDDRTYQPRTDIGRQNLDGRRATDDPVRRPIADRDIDRRMDSGRRDGDDNRGRVGRAPARRDVPQRSPVGRRDDNDNPRTGRGTAPRTGRGEAPARRKPLERPRPQPPTNDDPRTGRDRTGRGAAGDTGHRSDDDTRTIRLPDRERTIDFSRVQVRVPDFNSVDAAERYYYRQYDRRHYDRYERRRPSFFRHANGRYRGYDGSRSARTDRARRSSGRDYDYSRNRSSQRSSRSSGRRTVQRDDNNASRGGSRRDTSSRGRTGRDDG